MKHAFLTEEAFGKLADAHKEDYIKLEPAKAKELTGDEGLVRQFDLGPVAGFAMENAKGLRAALNEERQSVGSLKGQLSAFEGFDVGEAKKNKTRLKEMEDWTPSDKVAAQIEEKVTAVGEQWRSKYDAAVKGEKTAVTQLEERVLDDAVRVAIKAHHGNEDLLYDKVRARVKPSRDEAGKMIPIVVGTDGKPVMSQRLNEHGHMSIDESVEGMKGQKTLRAAFTADGGPGTGGKPPEGAGGSDESHFSSDDAITISRTDAKDATKYQAARAAAEKAGHNQVIIAEPE